jgi:hypothetical protein
VSACCRRICHCRHCCAPLPPPLPLLLPPLPLLLLPSLLLLPPLPLLLLLRPLPVYVWGVGGLTVVKLLGFVGVAAVKRAKPARRSAPTRTPLTTVKKAHFPANALAGAMVISTGESPATAVFLQACRQRQLHSVPLRHHCCRRRHRYRRRGGARAASASARYPARCNCVYSCLSDMLVDNLCDHGCHSMEIVDQLRIPADLPKGDYVLGWRWGARYHHQAGFFFWNFLYMTHCWLSRTDCEESTQVWSSCSDVAIE